MKREQALSWVSRAVTFVGILALVGMMPFLSGKDPAAAILRARSAEQIMTEEALSTIRAQLGLGDSALETLWIWLRGVLQGDFGTSWVSGAPVLPSVLTALGTSLSLMLTAFAVALVIAALLCLRPVLTGLRGNAKAGSGWLAATLTALPEFLLASILLIVVSVWMGLLPPFGWGGTEHYVLPALSLGIPAGGLLGRLLSESLVHAFREPWVITWHMAGYSHARIARAAFARALPGLMPQIGLILVGLTGGAVAVEQIFSIPGIGRTALGAAGSSDLPMLQASVIVLLLLGSLAGLGTWLIARILLGAAVDAHSLAATTAPRSHRGWWITPTLFGALLLTLTAAGFTGDPYALAFDRLASPGSTGDGGTLALFGADSSGRDVLARVGNGAIITIALALACALLSWVLGVALGLVPWLSLGPLEAANAMPPVLSGLIVATLFGPSAWGATLAVLLVSWAPLAAHTASLREEAFATPYATMAPLLGISRTRYMWRTAIPTIAGTVFRHAMLRVPGIALAIASLGFLGLGPQPPATDWGLMLADGITYLERAPWVAFAPMIALIALSAVAVSLSSRKV